MHEVLFEILQKKKKKDKQINKIIIWNNIAKTSSRIFGGAGLKHFVDVSQARTVVIWNTKVPV